ncbi:type VI secretion system tube protein Hcp [Pseudomonas syringae]|nr:type VI secretion system tube protein Hcp [Pseudomonas syringae]
MEGRKLMAFETYLKIEGIPGEALDAQFKD